jgi:hypothetical protein
MSEFKGDDARCFLKLKHKGQRTAANIFSSVQTL